MARGLLAKAWFGNLHFSPTEGDVVTEHWIINKPFPLETAPEYAKYPNKSIRIVRTDRTGPKGFYVVLGSFAGQLLSQFHPPRNARDPWNAWQPAMLLAAQVAAGALPLLILYMILGDKRQAKRRQRARRRPRSRLSSP